MKIKKLEKKIWDIEGFAVVIRHPDGTNVHGALEVKQPYSYERAAKNDWTVAKWKSHRFGLHLPQFIVDVLNGDGHDVAGNTRLGTVRDSYEED